MTIVVTSKIKLYFSLIKSYHFIDIFGDEALSYGEFQAA